MRQASTCAARRSKAQTATTTTYLYPLHSSTSSLFHIYNLRLPETAAPHAPPAMTSFAALMALSATQTRQSEAQVQSQLAERKRREEEKRKQLEEKERKEREMEARLRQRALEEAQRAKEREARLDAERRAKEAALRRKEEEQRDALRYGPKKGAAGYPTSGAARDELRRRRAPDEDDEPGGAALTREEKRQMRLQRELNYGAGAARRAVGGYKKSGRRLAGGAVDVDATPGSSAAGSGTYRSVKERLAHEPPGLIRLNVNKRDTRTIDEILQDRAKAKAAKTLAGEEAKAFDDWFGKSKSKTNSTAPPSPPSSIFSSRSNSPVREPVASSHASKAASQAASRASKSLSGTPPVMPQPSGSKPSASTPAARPSTFLTSKGSGVRVQSVGKPADKSSAHSAAPSKATPSRPALKSTPSASRAATTSSLSRSAALPGKPSGAAGKQAASAASFKKRPRSPSLSPSPPPAKQRRSAPPAHSSAISDEIWKLFGKDRHEYVARDVYSDDEDMEAGARDLESEEKYRSVHRLCMLSCKMTHCALPSVPRSLVGRTSWHWKRRSATRRRSAGRSCRRTGGAESPPTHRRVHDRHVVCFLILGLLGLAPVG